MTCTEAAVEPYPAGGTAQVYAGLVDVVAVSKGAVHGCGPGCQHRESHLAHFHPHFRPRASRSSYDDAHHNNLALLHVSKAFWLDTDWVRAAVRARRPPRVSLRIPYTSRLRGRPAQGPAHGVDGDGATAS